MKNLKKLIAVCLVLAFTCVALLAGCGGSKTPEVKPSDTKAAEAEKTETKAEETKTENAGLPLEKVRISLSSKLVNLDYCKPRNQPDIIGTYFIGGRLYRLNMDWSIEPEMAEALPEFSADGLTATVKLKAGLKYSDGTPVKAEDVVYAYERNRDVPGVDYANTLKQIKSVEAKDDLTIVFKMDSPYLDLNQALGSAPMFIHPKSKILADADYFLHPVSAGPYVIKDWTPGDSTWVMEENPNYVRGPMAIKRVEFIAIPDQTSRVLQLSTGVIDFVYDLPIPAMGSLPPEIIVQKAPLNGQYHVAFNLGLPESHPLRNAKVRQAISLAIDREEINKKAFGGITAPATSFQYPGTEEGLSGLFGKQDLEQAKKLLQETPFAGGFTVELQTWGQRAGWTDACLVIAENLEEIGITAKILPVEDAVAVANLKAGKYEMQFSGNASAPMTFFRNQFYPGSFWTDVMKYNNPEVTKLIDEATNAADKKVRIEKIQQAQRLAYEDMPLMPICSRVVAVGSRIDEKILYIANLPAGTNPWIAAMSELSK